MRFRLILLLVVFGLLLGACGAGETPAVEPSPVPTDTPVPTPALTAAPIVPLAILLIPADMDAQVSDLYQKTVYDLTQDSGMRFQVLNNLKPADLEPGLKIVIALSTDPGISALAAAAPAVQFLAVNLPGVNAGGNVSILGNTSQVEVVGFLAGYTAAMLTDDYRIGMLIPKDNSDAVRMFNAYADGMKFYCGACRPYFFLPYSFPQFLEIPAEEDVNNYDAYADILILQRKVETLFIHPDIYTQDLVDYVGTTGVSMIGTITPDRKSVV